MLFFMNNMLLQYAFLCGQMLWTFLTTFRFANSKKLSVYELKRGVYETCDMVK